ncbi:hypothetical protein BDZ45DRAFT_158866 [Acephala macrosclerotiorum]|nr:hypothetical protein BDZ45DRAFT_158866 [Acephala macrosclerotiorum]
MLRRLRGVGLLLWGLMCFYQLVLLQRLRSEWFGENEGLYELYIHSFGGSGGLGWLLGAFDPLGAIVNVGGVEEKGSAQECQPRQLASLVWRTILSQLQRKVQEM